MSEHVAPADQKSGTWIHADKETDQVIQTDTVSCCHCGRVWMWVPGSGRRRGFCQCCNQFTCGSTACDKCVPVEQLLENIEQGKPLDHRPTIVAASSNTPIPRG